MSHTSKIIAHVRPRTHKQARTHARARAHTHTHTHTGIDRVGIPVVCDDDPDALLRDAGLPLPRQPRRAPLLGSRLMCTYKQTALLSPRSSSYVHIEDEIYANRGALLSWVLVLYMHTHASTHARARAHTHTHTHTSAAADRVAVSSVLVFVVSVYVY